MVDQSKTDLSDALPSIIESLFPVASHIVRVISTIFGVDLLPCLRYILPLVALPVITSFTLPWVLGALQPLLSMSVLSAEIKFRNDLYPEVMKWMSTVKFHSLSSSMIVGLRDSFAFMWDFEDTVEYLETDDPRYLKKLKKVRFTPGQRHFHFFWHQKHLFAIYRDPQDQRDDPLSRNAENIFIYCFSWNKDALGRLMETIQKVNVDRRRGKLAVFSAYQDKRAVSWKPMCEEHPRALESLALSEAMKEEIMSDLKWFFSHGVADCFKRRGIAHRRGYLFHGEPGTGKTSLCRAIATELELPIYTISLPTVDDYGLQELFRTLPAERCLVLLEDIDTAGIQSRDNTWPGNDQEKPAPMQKGLSLATVLNALDGIGTHSGHLLVATTNVRPALDRALLRPGRIDKQIEFPNPDSSTIEKYFSFFFRAGYTDSRSMEGIPKLAVEFAQTLDQRTLTPAALQEYFLQYDGDPEMALENMASLLPKSRGAGLSNASSCY